MKRISVVIVIALMLSLDALALGPWSKSRKMVEGYGHISVTEGVNTSAGAALVWGKQHTKGFFLGAGAGLRYAHSVSETEDLGGGSRIVYFGDEALLPVFVRARFGRVRPMKLRPFVTADIGTVINLKPEGNTKGFFFEPQIGLDLAENVYVSLGVDTHHFLSRSLIRPSDVIGAVSDPQKKVKDIMTIGVSLHLGYSF